MTQPPPRISRALALSETGTTCIEAPISMGASASCIVRYNSSAVGVLNKMSVTVSGYGPCGKETNAFNSKDFQGLPSGWLMSQLAWGVMRSNTGELDAGGWLG